MPRPLSEIEASAGGAITAPLRWWRWLLIAYLVLLVMSHLVRWSRSSESTASSATLATQLPPEVSVVRLAPFVGQEAGRREVRLAYSEWGPSEWGSSERPAVVLLHGSPGQSSNFRRLGPILGRESWVIAPDLPGFGNSEHDVPDYSIRAHAAYVRALLNHLGVERVHVVGFSMGGGVALHLAEDIPQRVASIVLLSAIGLQEFELLGQYHLNHSVHGLQLAGLWWLHEGFPHFGALDGGMLDIPYARNFYDTDQRPLRQILATLQMPLLVVHGERDVLVPIEAAREHHRLVPHSELRVFPEANHFMVFGRAAELATPLVDFFARATSGLASRRPEASPERLALAANPRGELARIHGFSLVVWMFLVAAATWVSEDLACLAAGLIVAQGRVEFMPAVIACAVGIFLGDLGLYAAGRLGQRWLDRRPLSWLIQPQDVERSRRWFAHRGGWVIFLSRFLPGTRLPTYISAGLLRMNLGWFTLMLVLPVLLWTPILVGVARLFGERIFEKFDMFHQYALPGFLAALLSVWIFMAVLKSLATHKGRRLLVGWWKRKVEWEFWPLVVFYTPVVLQILRLGLRHRCLTLFTAANPGIPAGGGVVGESKGEILSKIDSRWVARYRLLPMAEPAELSEQVRAFRSELGLDYPIVLKPDQGQRGAGVRIAHGEEDVINFFASASGETIVQEYIGGKELGIFYIRLPGDEKGRIFAITDKVMPRVMGDGRRSLERLVLDDPRAVAMARTYLSILAERAELVPALGESVQLVELGTHCRGAVFNDGSRFITPVLEEEIERISRSFEGFYFGRFDMRAPSEDAFRQGRELKILELNGITSEATNIYDRKFRLWQAYGILFEQWRLAFEAGSRNRARGVRPLTLLELLRLVLRPSTAGF